MTPHSRRAFDLDDPACLFDVCQLKFRQNYSERDIARHYGFDQNNRTQIRKALKRAEQMGIVIKPHVALVRPGGVPLDQQRMERQLTERFGLKHAHVIEGFADAYLGEDPDFQNIVLDRIANAAALYFDSLMQASHRPEVVCVNWGYTMRLFTSHVLDLEPAQRQAATGRRKGPCRILPMVGIMGTGNRIQVAEREAYQLALELARKYDAVPRHLPCPAIIRDEHQAHVVEHLKPVRDSLDLLRKAEIAVTGIGSMGTTDEEYRDMTIVKQDLVTAEEVRTMHRRGAVGEIANWFFNAAGDELDSGDNSQGAPKPIGLGLSGVRDIVGRQGTVIAICGSDRRRLPALRAALNAKGKLITALFTDHLTAQVLLQD